ncbi:MAG: GntR family transcriptional regulator [Rhizobiaceae bacterium]
MIPEAQATREGADARQPTAKQRADRLFRILRDRICLLDYPPGHVLSEEEIATEFQVSRTPVRRVLAMLEAEGLVQSVHGVGTLVTDVNFAELEQVYRLRLELASLVGRLSPLPWTAEAFDRLAALIARCDAAMAEPDQRVFLQLNLDFFDLMNGMIGNAPLRQVSERLYVRVARVFFKMMPLLGLRQEFQSFRNEMTEVEAAARCGDDEAIGFIRRAHLSMSFTRMDRHRRGEHAV